MKGFETVDLLRKSPQITLTQVEVCQSDQKMGSFDRITWLYIYRKVANRSTSRLVARPKVFRFFMKGKFDLYVL